MSQEDDAIIQAASKRLYDHVTIGGDPFGVALADTMYVENMAASTEHTVKIVREMCDRAAAEVIRSYLGSLEAMGWAVVLKKPDEHQIDEASLKAGIGETSAKEVYAVMTAASPKPPGAGVEVIEIAP